MRKKLAVGVVAVGAVIAGWVSMAAHGSSTQALHCPAGLGATCGVVDPAIAAVCYSPLPQVPTIDFITITSSGRLVNCPEL